MPRPRSVMRKIREVLRLTFAEGLSRHLVGIAAGLPTTTVADYVGRAQRAGLSWATTGDFRHTGALSSQRRLPPPGSDMRRGLDLGDSERDPPALPARPRVLLGRLSA